MPVKRPIFRYCVLAFLFAITLAYEVPYLHDILRGETRSVPLFTIETATDRVDTVTNEAAQAGIRRGDEVVSIDGRPYRGLADWAHPFADTSIGGSIAVVLRSSDPRQPGERTVVLPVKATSLDPWRLAGALILYFFLPAICVLLGFWVAFQRPRDPMAWLLLALMLTFPHLYESYKAEAWPPGWREAAMLYHVTLGSMLPLVMFLFGRFFPEPFEPRSSFDRIWRTMQWTLAVPFTVFALIGAVESVIGLSNYRAAWAIERRTHPLDGVMQVAVYILISSFFAALGTKYGKSRSPDARRRLRIFYWGATVAWTPGLIVTVYARLQGKSLADVFPQWAILAALAPLVLFPLTLAYVIVVHKAMGVGVALRQGLQYAFAKNGVRALQILLVVAVAFAAVEILSDPSHGRLLKVGVILVGIILVLRIRKFADHLRAWLDRRFFREAYDAEQVLSELSEQVRTMVEPKSLLETVAARISQTLHVPQVAVLLGGDGLYRPAYAMGYGDLSGVAFPAVAATTRLLQKQKEPARVYLNDRDSWLYRDTDVTDEERSKLARLQSELLLPLAVRDKLLGFISLGPKKSEEPYTGFRRASAEVRRRADRPRARERQPHARDRRRGRAARAPESRSRNRARSAGAPVPANAAAHCRPRLRRILPARARRRRRLLRFPGASPGPSRRSHRRRLRQRHRGRADDGQPAGIVARRSDARSRKSCRGNCQHQPPGLRSLLGESLRDVSSMASTTPPTTSSTTSMPGTTRPCSFTAPPASGP